MKVITHFIINNMGTTKRAEELAKELSERLEGLCEGLAISGDSPSKETILNYFNELNNYRQSEIDELTKEVEHKNHTIENDAIHIETLTKEVERLRKERESNLKEKMYFNRMKELVSKVAYDSEHYTKKSYEVLRRDAIGLLDEYNLTTH